MIETLRVLTASVDVLTEEVNSLKREVHRKTSVLWAAIVACAVVVVILGAIGFTVGLDNRRAVEENNRRWCPMVGVLIPRPGEEVPTTERGRIVIDNAKQLYKDFGCA